MSVIIVLFDIFILIAYVCLYMGDRHYLQNNPHLKGGRVDAYYRIFYPLSVLVFVFANIIALCLPAWIQAATPNMASSAHGAIRVCLTGIVFVLATKLAMQLYRSFDFQIDEKNGRVRT